MATYAQLDKVLTPMAPIAYRGNDTTSGGIVYGSTSMNINGGLVYRTNTLKGTIYIWNHACIKMFVDALTVQDVTTNVNFFNFLFLVGLTK